MSTERIIGIDFGTSTSVVRVKTYKDNKPLREKREADYVRFNNRNTVPTLLYEAADGKYFYGYEAENAAVKGELYQNFKLDLISGDDETRNKALKHTEMFINYLYKIYAEQNNIFPVCESESTFISYPAKWSNEIRNFMTDAAKKAGFKNVTGLDEPTAAVHTVMIQENERLKLNEQGFANILMIDMGAGTTDLVLCRYDDKTGITIISVYPPAESESLMGGREMDEIFCDYVRVYLEKCGLANSNNFNKKNRDKCKDWKENNISPVFKSPDGVVNYCGFVDTIVAMLNVEMDFPPISRSTFEDMFSEYLSQLPQMINGCLNDAGFTQSDVDYVILTGGHSQWYFTEEILKGNLSKFGNVSLPQILADNNRIIKMAVPQETVALGLVYQKLNAKSAGTWKTVAFGVHCPSCGTDNQKGAKFCTTCGKVLSDGGRSGFLSKIIDESAEESNQQLITLPQSEEIIKELYVFYSKNLILGCYGTLYIYSDRIVFNSQSDKNLSHKYSMRDIKFAELYKGLAAKSINITTSFDIKPVYTIHTDKTGGNNTTVDESNKEKFTNEIVSLIKSYCS